MGFRVPSFNLLCRIWNRSDVPAGNINAFDLPDPRVTDQPCQLRAPGKLSTSQDANTFWIFGPTLLLPLLTDIRDSFTESDVAVALTGPDLVEVPQGSGWIYTVVYVDDAALGFANAYRFAFLQKNAFTPAFAGPRT
jgi:hypothetical protein